MVVMFVVVAVVVIEVSVVQESAASTNVTLNEASPVVSPIVALSAVSSKHVTVTSYVMLKLVLLVDVRTVLPIYETK